MPWRLRCGPEDQMFNNAIYHGKKRYNKTVCPTTKALQVLPGVATIVQCYVCTTRHTIACQPNFMATHDTTQGVICW
jgi:hypothetical protein